MSKCGKVCYKKQSQAVSAKIRLANCLLNTYKCKQCNAWHLGRSRDASRSAERITEVLEQYNSALKSRLDNNEDK